MNNTAVEQPILFPHLGSLAYAYHPPGLSGRIRQCPEDFQVDEVLSFQPSGQGPHVYLQIQKQLLTTEELVKQVAKFAGIKVAQVGYAGLKDRNALTSQWLSVDLSGKTEPDWSTLNSQRLTVISITRHQRKLKIGAIAHNKFHIKLHDLQGDLAELDTRLNFVKQRGVPNYFGEQRFGYQEDNLAIAYDMFAHGHKVKNRYLKGLYFSAARSYLYNLVLSHRVARGIWDQPLAGDAMVLEGSRSFFIAHELNTEIERRIREGDIHPSGPLWGKGDLATTQEAKALELNVLKDFGVWRHGLENQGLAQQRRPLRLLVKGFIWRYGGEHELLLSFKLVSGAYATSVVRELVRT
jgi:tRNA pseudouridine13 synthase